MARSSFAWADAERSATSSRKSVPPSACSNFPRRPRTPVAVRSSMPNSSASSSVSTSAAQLMATNGPAAAAAQLVDLPRHQLLARPALAFDEKREIGCRDAFDLVPQHAHRRGRADEGCRAVRPPRRHGGPGVCGGRARDGPGPRTLCRARSISRSSAATSPAPCSTCSSHGSNDWPGALTASSIIPPAGPSAGTGTVIPRIPAAHRSAQTPPVHR